MYDHILRLVKERLGNDPNVASAISPDKVDAVHEEIATQITNALENQSTPEQKGKGSSKNITGKLENDLASGGVDASVIERGLVKSLSNKFSLPPSAREAIAGALPGLLREIEASQPTVS